MTANASTSDEVKLASMVDLPIEWSMVNTSDTGRSGSSAQQGNLEGAEVSGIGSTDDGVLYYTSREVGVFGKHKSRITAIPLPRECCHDARRLHARQCAKPWQQLLIKCRCLRGIVVSRMG